MGKGGKRKDDELKESKKARKAKEKAKLKDESKKAKDKAKSKEKDKAKSKAKGKGLQEDLPPVEGLAGAPEPPAGELEEESSSLSAGAAAGEPAPTDQPDADAVPDALEAAADEPAIDDEPAAEDEPEIDDELDIDDEPATDDESDVDDEPASDTPDETALAAPAAPADDAPIITHDEIVAIPRIYKIGKRPLSKLLGWGELTYTRLIDGRTPNKQHAEELRRIIDEPAAYAEILERGRESGIITPLAYQKSRDAVDALLGDEAKDGEKFHAVASRFCVLAEGDLTPRALQVLVFYAHGWSFRILDAPLFAIQPAATTAGPEYAQIRTGYGYDAIQQVYRHAAEHDSRARRQVLADGENELVEAVYAHYGKFSGQELARMAREEQPYRKALKRADETPEGAAPSAITAKSMEKHFADAPCPITVSPAR